MQFFFTDKPKNHEAKAKTGPEWKDLMQVPERMRPTGPGGTKAPIKKKIPSPLLTSKETIDYVRTSQTKIENTKNRKEEREADKERVYKAELKRRKAEEAKKKTAAKRKSLKPKKLNFNK